VNKKNKIYIFHNLWQKIKFLIIREGTMKFLKMFNFALCVVTFKLVAGDAYVSNEPINHFKDVDERSKENNEALSKEEWLIMHLKQCITNGDLKKSKLSNEILAIDGMSSSKVRHFLNNLCTLPETRYLEIGVWKGSTFISAVYKNESTIAQAVAIDNWSQFGAPYAEFEKNIEHFVNGQNNQLYSLNCFNINLNEFSKPINIYFYDGDHSEATQEQAFTYFNAIFDDIFIAVVDDWNFPEVPKGTYSAFKKLKYHILFEQVLPADHNCDKANWWNGLYVAVIKK
jgi:hypothetical protein